MVWLIIVWRIEAHESYGADLGQVNEMRGCPILSRSLRKHRGPQRPISAVGFAAMADAANLYGVRSWAEKQKAVITDAQP
jgi:hypothetical protein